MIEASSDAAGRAGDGAPPETEAPPDTEDLGTVEEATELLSLVMGGARFEDPAYNRWLYYENPSGRAYCGNRREDDILAAHQTVVPQRWRTADGEGADSVVTIAWSLNSATRPGVRGKGYYSKMFKEVVDRATFDGAVGSYGVSNANSTPIVVKRVGFRWVGQLPVKVAPILPFKASEWEHHPVDAELLESTTFKSIADGLDRRPRFGLRVQWTPEILRWRLAAPKADYTLHVSPELIAVSTREVFKGVPVAVILKLFSRRERSRAISGQAAMSAACLHHRAPLALYAGFNSEVKVRGVQPPRKLLPAPLNLMYLSTTERLRPTDFRADVFEFLDFDAY